MALVSKLTLQNAAALALLPLYLGLRPLLRLLGVLRPRADGPWVFGGHSGRLYADNAAAVHGAAHADGRAPWFVVSDAALARSLRARGVRVLRRNSLRARIAIENAAALVYSHGVSDLDHVLARFVPLAGLKVHLNHCMNHLKAGQLAQPRFAALSEDARRLLARALDPFDALLASSERERTNFVRCYPGRDAQIVLGGGAHLDKFMAARSDTPRATLVYMPTFRETPAARARLDAVIDALTRDPRLAAYLARAGVTLEIAAHVNRGEHKRATPGPHVRFVPPAELEPSLLAAGAFISDYSGVLCDQLALDRPTIFFPFDADDYLAGRALFVTYDELAWGPVVRTADALVELVCSGRYRDLSPYAERRAHWQREFFPELSPGYAARSLATIDGLLGAPRG